MHICVQAYAYPYSNVYIDSSISVRVCLYRIYYIPACERARLSVAHLLLIMMHNISHVMHVLIMSVCDGFWMHTFIVALCHRVYR